MRRSPALLRAAAAIAAAADRDPTPDHLHELGVASLVLGDSDAAVRTLETAAAADPRSASIHNDLAVAYLALADESGRFDRVLLALTAVERALRVAPQQPEATYNLGLVLERLHLEERARVAWRRHVQIAVAASEGWSAAARQRLTLLEARPSSPPSWREMFDSLDGALARDDAVATTRIAATHPDAARSYLEEVVPVRWADATIDRERVVRHAALIAASPPLAGDTHAREIVAWLRTTTAGATVADAVRRLIVAADLIREDRYAEIGAALGDAPVVLRAARSPLEPIARYYAIMPAVQRGDFRTARPELDGLAAHTGRAGYDYWRGVVLNRLGQVYGRDGDQQAAIRAREAAIDHFTRARSEEQVAVMHSMIAECYRNLGDPSSAWRHHAEALRRLPDIDNYRSRHLVVAQAGLTAANARLWEAGETLQTAVIDNGLAWRRASGVATGFLQRARSRYKVSARAAATDDIAEAERWIARIPDRDFRERIALELLEVKGEVSVDDDPKAALAALDAAVGRFLATGFGARLAGLMSRRADVYRRLGRSEPAIADLETGLARLEEERARLSEEQLRMAQSGVLRQVALALAEYRLARPESRDEAFRLVDLPRAKTLVEQLVSGNRTPVSVSDIRRALASDSVLLHYTIMRDRVLLWEITQGADAVHVLEVSPGDLIEAVRRYRRALAGDDDSRTGYSATTQALGRMLFDPVRGTIARSRTVMVAPDGYLYGVAFPSLPLDGSRVLAADHDVLIVPSGSAAFAVNTAIPSGTTVRAAAGAQRPVLIVGVSSTTGSRAPLPWVRDEVGRVRRFYPHTLVLEDGRASKSAVLAALDRAPVVHFAGHAASNPDRPLLSRLLLAGADGQPDPLYAYEITRRDLRGAVVVLSACSTGFNDAAAEGHNEGVLSLARGFLAAGAVAVVASLVDVRDADAPLLMAAFHEALARGASPVAALRSALDERRRSSPATASHTWQSFVVIGQRAALRGAL